jgi:hypothetical protein
MYSGPTESSEDEYDSYPRRSRGGTWREDPVPLDQGSWTRDIIEKSGIGEGK